MFCDEVNVRQLPLISSTFHRELKKKKKKKIDVSFEKITRKPVSHENSSS